MGEGAEATFPGMLRRRRLAARLTQEQLAHRAGAVRGTSGPRPNTPAQLPRDLVAFAGREAELAQLDTLLEPAGDADGRQPRPTAVVISAVSGTAGIGKTALAVHWAHRVADLDHPDAGPVRSKLDALHKASTGNSP